MNRINQILNVSSREWPRIMVAWSILFLVRFGFIVGWTMMMATFLSRVGINYLPLLFLVNGILVMGGAMIYRNVIHRVKRELLISLTILGAAVFLVAAMLFTYTSTFLFFMFLLLAESVLLSQLNILISLLNEELFTPLESQRTFPIVDSAETIGGIMGGLVLTVFANSLPAYKFIIIWILAILLILPIVLKFNTKTMYVPQMKTTKKETAENLKLGDMIRKIRKVPFLKTLMIVVMLQWAIMNVVEFQYTKAVQQEVYSIEEQTLVYENPNEIHLASTTPSATEDYEHEFTKKLGGLHLIFNTGALFIQLILASRILVKLGISSSMLIHPIITLLNLIALTLRFGFFPAAITRGSFELTHHIHKTAYDSSYYAIPHQIRSDAKEVMQGFMKPLGAIMGTSLIALFSTQFHGVHQTFALNLILIIMTFAMASLTMELGRKYTSMSEQNLSRKLDLPSRLNAVEILAQNGHEKLTPALQKILKRKNEPLILKERIIQTLGARQDLEAIGTLLDILSEPEDELRLAAVQALGNYNELKKHIMKHSFTRYRVLETLKETIQLENDEHIREVMVKTIYTIAPEQVIEFLVKSIKDDDENRASFIRMLRLFEDPNLKNYLSPFLKDKSPDIRAASIIGLWKFKRIRNELEHHLNQLLESSKPDALISGLEASGLVNYSKAKMKIKPYIKDVNPEIQNAAVLAMARMEEEAIIPQMISLFLTSTHDWFERTNHILEQLPKRFRQKVFAALHIQITDIIGSTLKKNQDTPLEELGEATLHYLKTLYQKIGAHHEVQKIEKVLASEA